ncbi:DUF6191 domain-containing protein [Streptomyces sp. DH18]|uniref:DUF6191 domain-containing protein n=1 Tax=unclassified Streptomyces TaxID=2593676 RepID=UPI001E2AB6BB|nr:MULTISPECIES: DUF6191 domain-containing protein [unclassified Streptomyces]MDG9684691.1 DUF6191 domain-containing protein [Streptomyces sp. DH18]
MFNFFEELFAPGRKHVSDEQKRLELSRVDLGIGDPNRGPIDLTSGKVTVRAPAPETAPAVAPDVAPEQDAVLDRPRPGNPAGGPERREDEEPGRT